MESFSEKESGAGVNSNFLLSNVPKKCTIYKCGDKKHLVSVNNKWFLVKIKKNKVEELETKEITKNKDIVEKITFTNGKVLIPPGNDNPPKYGKKSLNMEFDFNVVEKINKIFQ
jgi:hypothetical protein